MSQAETKSQTRIKPNIELREPSMYKVIYLNDDKTSVEFVIASLVEHFHYSHDTAEKITLDIHDSGSAVVAVLPYEMAEQKGIEITISARNEGYPLQIKIEPENA